MPLLGFKKQFATMVELGLKVQTTAVPGTAEAIIKRQTIRAKRKDGRNPHVGDTLYLYTGLRTKACRKLGEAVCVIVEEIVISKYGPIVAGNYLSVDDASDLAFEDGFKCYGDMLDFFEKEHGLPFWGLLIKW